MESPHNAFGFNLLSPFTPNSYLTVHRVTQNVLQTFIWPFQIHRKAALYLCGATSNKTPT